MNFGRGKKEKAELEESGHAAEPSGTVYRATGFQAEPGWDKSQLWGERDMAGEDQRTQWARPLADEGRPDDGQPDDGQPDDGQANEVPASSAAEPADPPPADRTPWSRYQNERWVVGDEGRQPNVQPRVARGFKAPPPDIVIDGADVGAITFRAASVRGIGHQERGEPRQDAYAVRFTKDQKWLVGCVADGVSEGFRSHEAAAAAADRLTDKLVTFLTQYPPPDQPDRWPEVVEKLPWAHAVASANKAILDDAREHLTRVYQRQGDEARLRKLDEGLPFAHARGVMSTTAIVFAVATEPLPDGRTRAFLANVAGDSAAFRLDDGHWSPMTEIKNEGQEIFSGSVKSLPNNVEVRPTPFYLDAGQAFVVMTDGLGDPIGQAQGEVGAFLALKWQTPPDALAFANHVAFYKKTFADDRTAVMIWCHPVRKNR